ncbi:MAG: NFACT RNA binding domain-containing protein [Candidatus Woesearchaeota archaeon]
MKVAIDIRKSVDENAADYFERAKKAKKKLEGAEKTLVEFKRKQERAERQAESVEIKSSIKKLDHHKKRWFEKFKWFISSEGFLVVGARDATTNEIVIKKHTDNNDVVFHTDMAGSPFVVVKQDDEDVKRMLGEEFLKKRPELPGEQTLVEAASFTAIHSKAWKMGLQATNVFYVSPEQVSKEANTGEFMGKGSFMIRGKTTYIDPKMVYAAGIVQPENEEPFYMAGPKSSVEALTEDYVIIDQGDEKTSNAAKQVRTKLREKTNLDIPVDDIVQSLPSGGCKVRKERRRK